LPAYIFFFTIIHISSLFFPRQASSNCFASAKTRKGCFTKKVSAGNKKKELPAENQ